MIISAGRCPDPLRTFLKEGSENSKNFYQKKSFKSEQMFRCAADIISQCGGGVNLIKKQQSCAHCCF